MNFYKILPYIVKLIFFITFVISFQNCSFKLVASDATSVLDVKSGKLGGNGEGYAGLQKNTFYKFENGFSCLGVEMAQSSIIKNQEGLIYKSYSHLLCEPKTQNLPIESIDQSKFQDDIIGYQEGIYVGLDVKPTSIPVELVEVWCQSLDEKKYFETISYYNSNTKKANTRVYYSLKKQDLNEKVLKTEFNVSRLIENKSIKFSNENKFNLSIDRLQTIPNFQGQFKGVAIISDSNFAVEQLTVDLRCRLGGALDISIWPAQRLVDLNFTTDQTWAFNPVQWFYENEQQVDEQKFFYKIKSINSDENQLFQLDLFKAQQKIVDNKLLYKSPKNFVFKLGESMLTLEQENGKIGNKNIFQLFQLDLQNNQISKITNQAAVNRFGENNFQNLPKNQIVFSEWIQPLDDENFGTNLKIYDPSSLSNSSIEFSNSSNIKKNLGYIYQQKMNQIFIAEYNNNNYVQNFYFYKLKINKQNKLENFSSKFLKWPWQVTSVDTFSDPDPDNSIRFEVLNFQNGENFSYITSIDGKTSLALPNDARSLISPDGKTVFYTKIMDMFQEISGKTANSYFVDVSNNQLKVIDGHVLFEPYFTKNSQNIIGDRRQMVAPFSRSFSISVENSNSQTELCAEHVNSTVSTVTFDVFKDQSILLVALDTDKANVYFYKVNLNNECYLLNSITSKDFDQRLFESLISVKSTNAITNFKSYFRLKMSPDHSSFIFGVRYKPLDSEHLRSLAIHKLIYVPLDGKASYVINTPLNQDGVIHDFKFLQDSKSVLYIGNQVDKQQHNIFIWQKPKN